MRFLSLFGDSPLPTTVPILRLFLH
jgi:hypothetical protein